MCQTNKSEKLKKFICAAYRHEKHSLQGENMISKHRVTRNLSFILILTVFLSSCALLSEYGRLERDARSAYQRADYDTAVQLLARSLQLNPEYEKSQYLMTDAFMMSNRLHLDQIKNLEAGGMQFRHDQIVKEYQALQMVHDAVRRLPPVRHPKTGVPLTLEIKDFSAELMEAKEAAAEAHYQAAILLAASDAMENQKAAAKEFKRSLGFIPDYKDASSR